MSSSPVCIGSRLTIPNPFSKGVLRSCLVTTNSECVNVTKDHFPLFFSQNGWNRGCLINTFRKKTQCHQRGISNEKKKKTVKVYDVIKGWQKGRNGRVTGGC